MTPHVPSLRTAVTDARNVPTSHFRLTCYLFNTEIVDEVAQKEQTMWRTAPTFNFENVAGERLNVEARFRLTTRLTSGQTVVGPCPVESYSRLSAGVDECVTTHL